MCLTDQTPLGRREYARAVASRGSLRPCWRRCRGPQQEWLGDPGSSREPLHVKSVGKDIFTVQTPASKVSAYSLLIYDKKFFNDRMKTTKPPATDIVLIVLGLFMPYTLGLNLWIFLHAFSQIKLRIKEPGLNRQSYTNYALCTTLSKCFLRFWYQSSPWEKF